MNMSNQEVDPDDVGVLEGLDGGATTTSYVVATYFGFRNIDRLGRRKLAIGGFAGMAAFMLVAAVEEVVAVFERQATGTRANALEP
jgi:hypothetical protein